MTVSCFVASITKSNKIGEVVGCLVVNLSSLGVGKVFDLCDMMHRHTPSTWLTLPPLSNVSTLLTGVIITLHSQLALSDPVWPIPLFLNQATARVAWCTTFARL